MERIELEFDNEVMERLKSLKKEGETIQETIRRIILTYYPPIDQKEWNKNAELIFDEFENSFQRLAE